MRRVPVLFLCVMFGVSTIVSADEIVLTNGNVLIGNIILEDKQKGEVVLDVVLEDELMGVKMVLKISEIKSITKNDAYRNLVKKEVSQEAVLKTRELIRKKMEKAKDVDQRIMARVRRIRDHIRYIEQQQEDKRRFEKELEHQKEMLLLELEAQKELITHSKNSGAQTGVNVYNGL